MKRIGLACLLFALSPVAALAQSRSQSDSPYQPQDDEITGGIIYSDGKDAIYYDFKTGKETNLTSDIENAQVTWPFGAASDGSRIVWPRKSKFWVRQLPGKKPYAIRYKNDRHHDHVCDTVEDFVWEGKRT